MEIHHLSDYYRGWFLGDFIPTVFQTQDFEVGVLSHYKGEYWAPHYHEFSTEINVILEGSMVIKGTVLNKDDIFILRPKEIADPQFLTNCKVLVIKVPSVPGDKVLVTDKSLIN